MNLREVCDRLTKNREFYRVLPDKIQLELSTLIVDIEEAINAEDAEVTANVVAEGAEKVAKVPKRSYRKRVE